MNGCWEAEPAESYHPDQHSAARRTTPHLQINGSSWLEEGNPLPRVAHNMNVYASRPLPLPPARGRPSSTYSATQTNVPIYFPPPRDHSKKDTTVGLSPNPLSQRHPHQQKSSQSGRFLLNRQVAFSTPLRRPSVPFMIVQQSGLPDASWLHGFTVFKCHQDIYERLRYMYKGEMVVLVVQRAAE